MHRYIPSSVIFENLMMINSIKTSKEWKKVEELLILKLFVFPSILVAASQNY